MEEQEALVELLEEFLGDHGLHYPNRGQISFNCPVCPAPKPNLICS